MLAAVLLIHNCFETKLTVVFRVQRGSVFEPTEYICDRMENV